MFWCVAVADVDIKCAGADLDGIALLDAPKAERYGVDDIGIIERLLRAAFLNQIRVHARGLVERDGFWRRGFLIIEQQHPREQPSRARCDQFGPVNRLQPARHANVIGVMMRDQNARHRFAAERPREDFPPCFDHPLGMETCVDDAPSIPVFKRVNVDVIELHRQGHADPKDTLRDFDCLTLGGWGFKREVNVFQRLSSQCIGVERVKKGIACGGRGAKRADLRQEMGGVKGVECDAIIIRCTAGEVVAAKG